MMIWVHKGMITKGASKPPMQMDASLGLSQAGELQSQQSLGPPLEVGALGMSSSV